MESLLSIGMGIALSAACGLRVFVPLLVLSAAATTGHVTLADGFAWIGTPPALITFAVATVLEIAAYHVPWLDNALDTIATPAAVVAGVLTTASVVTDISPWLRWTLALIAGGGIAGFIQGTTVTARTTSLVGTAGLANPVVAAVETGGSILTALVAVAVPALALLLVVGFAVYLFRRRRPARARRHAAGSA